MAVPQHEPAVTQREDIVRQGVMDGFDFGPFKMPEMTAIVDSFIRKPKMTKPFHFSEAEMNALAPKNIADAIEVIRPPRSNSHGSVNLRYHIQTPPERSHMSPAFDIRYVSEMKEQGMLGLGWTIGKFILQKDDSDNSYIWNYKKYSNSDCRYAGYENIKEKEEGKKITITEDDIIYTFVKSKDPKLFVLDNSAYKGDSIKYYYTNEKDTPVDAKRNYVKIDYIACKYKEDMIPHVKIKFNYKGNGLLKEIQIQTSKEKYEFTKKDAREEKEERYEAFCNYTFNNDVEAADKKKNKSKYLLKSVMQTFVYTVGKKPSYKDFIHSFEYYDDKKTIELLDELTDIYVDPVLTDDVEGVRSRIDNFRVDRTDLLKVVHTPLGACYTVNYGREIFNTTSENEATGEGSGEESGETTEKGDTVLVMNYLKINDGYRQDGPLVLNRYSYANGKVFEIEPIEKKTGETEDEKKTIVVFFDTVYTYNMDTINNKIVNDEGAVMQTMKRHYISNSGSVYESESPLVEKEIAYEPNGRNLRTKEFAYENCSFKMTVSGEQNYNVRYIKNKNYISYNYNSGSISQQVNITEDGKRVKFVVSDNGNNVFREELKYDNDEKTHATFMRYKDENTFISYDLTYDEFGNMVKCVMPSNKEGGDESLTYYYEYDRRFNQYQTGVVDSRGFTSHMEDYDYTIGQPKTIRDINGYVKKFGYRFNAIIDTVVSPIRIDNAAGNSEKIYSAASEFSDVGVVRDRKTMGVDRKDTLKLGVDIEIKDSVKNALLSDATREKLTELLSGKNESVVMMDTCKLTFDLDNLHFGDTVAFVECYCNNVITTPSSIQLKRYDEYNPENDKLATSLYVDGVGRELYRKNEVPTVYDATRYDVLAQQTHLIKPYEKTMPESGDSVKYTPTKFDEVGRVKRLESLDKFGNKNVQIFNYDAVGRVTRYSDNNSDYVYTYDMLGNITEVKDRKNFTTTSYTYDNAGNVISKTTPSGDVISYVYKLDNLTEIKYPRIPSANVTNIYGNKNSSYGRRNRVALSYNSSVVDEYFYNQQGNVAKVRRTMIVPNGKILTYVTEFKYDTWGRLLEMIYPDGEILTYSFNNAGLANKVNGSKTFKVDEHKNFDYKYIDEVTYDYLGRLKEVNFHNGMKKTVQYDNDNKPVYSIIGGDLSNVGRTKLDSCMGDVKEGFDENSGMAAISNDGYLSSYFYDMSGNLAMNIGALNEKIYVNGQLSGVSSLIEDKHLIVNPYFEDQDSLCVKHVILNGERVITKVVDTFSYGACPVRIERAGSNADEIGYEVDYEALHTLTSGDAIQERVATVGDEFSVEHKPFDYPQLRNANVDDGEDNEETDIYVYGVDKNNNLVGLFDKDKKMVLEIYKNADNTERIYKSDDLKFIPLIRSNEYMRDIANDMVVPMFELNNELHQVRDAFGR